MHKNSKDAWIRQPLKLLCKEGGISKPAAIILALIIDQATDTKPPSPVIMSQGELANDSGYGKTSVKMALKELEHRGLIIIHRTGRESVYELTGAVELLPPKRERKQYPRQYAKTKGERQMTAQELEQMQGYLSVVNRFRDDEEPEVCEKPAEEGDPDYELA